MIKNVSLSIFAYFCTSRFLILAVLVLAGNISLSEAPARRGTIFESELILENVGEKLEYVLRSADAAWYEDIATKGYHQTSSPSDKPQNWTFFPLFPLLVSALMPIVGSAFVAGLIVSNLSFLGALFVFALYLKESKIPDDGIKRTLFYLCFFPASYFFISPITESLFLFLTISSFYLLATKRTMLSGLVYALASATRPTAILMLPAFAFALWKSGDLKRARGWIALCTAPLGALAFMTHLYFLTGDPFAFSTNQAQWNRFNQGFLALIADIVSHPERLMISWNFLLVNSLAAIAGLILSLVFALRRDFVWALAIAGPICAALATGSVMSMTRFIAALFPVTLGFALLTSNPNWERITIALFAGLLTAMTILYGIRATAGMA